MSLFVLLLARVFFVGKKRGSFNSEFTLLSIKLYSRSVLRWKYYLHGVVSELVPWLWKFAIFTLVITKMSMCPFYYDFGIVIIVMGINFRFWKWGDQFRSDPKLRGYQVHISLFYNCVTGNPFIQVMSPILCLNKCFWLPYERREDCLYFNVVVLKIWHERCARARMFSLEGLKSAFKGVKSSFS